MHRIVLSLFVACCLVAVVTPAHSQYTLEYKFEKGKIYRFGDSTFVNSSQEMMGQEMKSKSNVLSTTKVVTTDVTAGKSAVMEVSPEALKISITSAQMDTTIVPTDMIGKRTRITVSPLGEVTNRQVIDSVRASGLMRGVGQREVIRFHMYPGKSVKIGDTWNATRNDSTMGTVVTTSKMQYTLAGKEQRLGKDALKLTYTGTLTIKGKSSMMGMQVFVEGSGKVSGVCYVDPVNGLPLYDESTSDMESTYAVTGQQNMTIPSSQTVVSHRTLLSD